ncbi:SelT/SelW/SelH family protein [bacterium]|nr:SelT/SelW/SelH family protein [bacterium]
MDRIKKDLGIKTKLKPSGGGVFEIRVNGDLIYSKIQTGQFPDEFDIIEKLKAQ